MKVLVNGGLNLSELDGWWAEAYCARHRLGLGRPPGARLRPRLGRVRGGAALRAARDGDAAGVLRSRRAGHPAQVGRPSAREHGEAGARVLDQPHDEGLPRSLLPARRGCLPAADRTRAACRTAIRSSPPRATWSRASIRGTPFSTSTGTSIRFLDYSLKEKRRTAGEVLRSPRSRRSRRDSARRRAGAAVRRAARRRAA